MTPGGYAWWYLDALSDDGRYGITLIAFIGSVFSPYYAWARRRGVADPYDHCALNVALYGETGGRWTMTERGRRALHRDATTLVIGPSLLRWDGTALTFRIDEIAAPLPRRVRGEVRVLPRAIVEHTSSLDAAGRHHWTPIAPCARVEVDMTDPAIRWSGTAYLDSNRGDEPLEAAIRRWNWSRGDVDGETVVLYDSTGRDGRETSIALAFDGHGAVRPIEPPQRVALPSTRWRISRTTRSQDGEAAIVRTLEDTPFYARSLVTSRLLGQHTRCFHESLDLDRFRLPIVQAMLPFRMPRRR